MVLKMAAQSDHVHRRDFKYTYQFCAKNWKQGGELFLNGSIQLANASSASRV